MIPLQLELTNFLSYRETAVLDLDGIHLACISGQNGAGKSSILDGMIWALFGKSRASSDDDIVNRVAARNGKKAEVRFTFNLDGGVYRIVRSKKAGGRKRLELQMAADDLGWKTLSETKMRETQAAIENLLRMNYDTFTNASFLLQGKADEFTTKPPSRRKEILADLLGVTQWDGFKETAVARRKEAEGRINLLDGLLDDIAEELGSKAEREAALETAKAAQAALAERLEDKETLLRQLRRAETAVKQQKQHLQNLETSIDTARRRRDELAQTAERRRKEREAHALILAEKEAIAAEFSAWEAAEAALQTAQAQADEHNKLTRLRHVRELAIAQERTRWEQRLQTLAARKMEVETAVGEQELRQRQLMAAQGRLEALGAALVALAEKETAYREQTAALQELQAERKLLTQRLAHLREEEQKISKITMEKTTVAANCQQATTELEASRAAIAALDEKQRRHAALRAKLDNLQAEQPRLKAQMDKLKERIDKLKEEVGGECPLCGQELSESHRRMVLDEVESEGTQLGDRYRENRNRVKGLKKETAVLQTELQRRDVAERELRARQAQLAKAEARLMEIERELARWAQSDKPDAIAELQERLADETAVAALQTKVEELKTAVAAKADLEKERSTQQKTAAGNEARLAEIEKLAALWKTEGAAALTAAQDIVEQARYALEDQQALAALDEQITAVGYDAIAHETARQTRDGLRGAAARRQRLGEAEAAVKPLDDALADLTKQLAEQGQALAALELQRETAVVELEKIAADSADLYRVEDEVNALREERIQADRRMGAALQKLEVLGDQQKRKAALTAERAEATTQVKRLKLLEQACGRNGVQALLIEQALPEIEDRANALLHRLTAGEMSIRFNTQKQLKSRDAVAETLDIQISDQAGERPYANFSGGEQFRVNFAIRLALSQLLARRAGASLRTLVIDEGFGSQDPNGRQRLVEAINTIQNDFDRILIITHVDELRDAFPTRIEVEKGVGGSQITVV